MTPRPLCLPAALAVTALAADAHGHELRGHVSQAGLDFVAAQVPHLVPKDLYPDDVSKDFACATATQRDTHVRVTVHDFAISIPQEGRLRLYINLSARGDGELHVDDAYACFGSMTCQDEFIINDARATIDFDVGLAGGAPSAEVRSVDLALSYDDIDINFSGCSGDDIANWMVDFAKKYVTDYLLGKAEELAREKLGPMVEEMLGGVGAFNGTIGSTDVTAALSDLYVASAGVVLGADVDLSSKFPANACVIDLDPGEPTDVAGSVPDLTAIASHIGLAVNFGLLNDALYHVWRRGLTCLTGDHLEALGVHLDTDHIMQIMPGFPPGTELGMEMIMSSPPRIRAASDDGAAVILRIDGLSVTLIGELPDGGERRVQIGLTAEVTAAIAVDPATNAMIATPTGIAIEKMEMDQVYAAETGFDVTRLRDMLQSYMLPKLLDKMGGMPVTGPVFTAGTYAVILRGLDNNDAFLAVNADLFRIPENDIGAPETSIIDYPYGTVSPADAVIQVSGVDGMIPTELLRFAVTVNGEPRPDSFVRSFKVGQVGESGTYQVQVSAMDLSGNVDTTPASVEVTVDGIAPVVLVTGERVRRSEGGPTELAWTMRDDMTAAALLATRIELFRITDPTDALAVEHVQTIELAPGATGGAVEITKGELYRAEVHVTDAVGNVTVATVLIDGQTGGCQVAGGGSPLLALLGIAFAALLLRRRR